MTAAALAHTRPAPPPLPMLTASLTPGGYMRDCRLRSGKSIADCANAIAIRVHDRQVARHDLQRLEANRPGDYGRLVKCLRDRQVFPFDFGLFATLAAETADPEADC